jgi:hypothetical protein
VEPVAIDVGKGSICGSVSRMLGRCGCRTSRVSMRAFEDPD